MKQALLTRDTLVASYHASGKPRERWRVGAEFERHLLNAEGFPLPYPGEPGVRWLMGKFERDGWTPYLEGEFPIALHRGEASITLEPGGQFELSGAPFRTVGEVEGEARSFAERVAHHLEGTGVRQAALGFTPYAAIDEVGWVPKGRYVVMREHLAQTGPLAHHMMKGTAAVQATYDYSDEEDAARKVRLATLLGPLTTATFANSPYSEGHASGYISYRGHIWTRTDPSRTGFPEAAARFTFAGWVDWLLQVPMMFQKDEQGRWQAAHGRTFAQWMEDGARPPDEAAWNLHLTSVFPEVRVKHTIEVRGADCVPLPLAMGFVALWKGLFYDDRALDGALEVARRFAEAGSTQERFDTACRRGLAGEVGGRRLASWAEQVIELADAGLSRLDSEDRRWLLPLSHQIATGKSPGQTLLEKLGDRPDPAHLLESVSMLG
jgi:glutamate--cysteine ligase